MSTTKEPVFKTDIEKTAYQAGLRAGLKPVPTVEQQQRKIAQQIKSSGPVTSSSPRSGAVSDPADHHPQDAYRSYINYKETLLEEGMAPNQDFEHWKRSHFGISTDSDHEQSQQQIHKNNIGGKSVQKGIPEHVHDKVVGKITRPDRNQGKTKPSAGVPGSQSGTPTPTPAPRKTYPYPYTNLPFDPRRTPEEIEDPSISQKYKTQLEQWSFENFNRYQKKQPLLSKPKPGDVFVDKDSSALGSSNSNTELQRLLKSSKLVLAEDKITPYQRTAGKQLPYWLWVDGKKQPKLYNAGGGLYDETGPRLQNIGRMKEGYTGAVDTPDKILNQGISRAFDLVGAVGGAAGAAAKVGKFAGVAARAGRAGTAAANRVRAIAAASRASRLARFGGRNPGSAGGLINRGSASLGRGASRIGELPSSGGVSRIGELPYNGADALQNIGL